jgi:hypothetical protein
MSNEIQILNQGESYETLHIRRRWSTWEIQQDYAGDVEISCEESGACAAHLSLSQDELKQVIAFLQSKIKEM